MVNHGRINVYLVVGIPNERQKPTKMGARVKKETPRLSLDSTNTLHPAVTPISPSTEGARETFGSLRQETQKKKKQQARHHSETAES